MSTNSHPFVREMIREAVEALGSPTTNVAVRDWIEERYPGTNRGTIQAQRIVCTVNQPSRVHYPENRRPRLCDDTRYDFLYCSERGKLEWYRPEKHGLWSIEQDEDGRIAIACDEGELIYPKSRGRSARVTTPVAERCTRPATPMRQSQIEAAGRLHARLKQWSSTDRAFEKLRESFPGFDREACILKSAAINDLYSTRVFAIWRMAEHLMQVMQDPPDDPAALVEAIACLPSEDGSGVDRKHWSFASKVCHFFVDEETFPIYDSFCRNMIAHHLGRGRCVSDPADPYRAFMENLQQLRQLSGLSASLRELDRYLWLAGQYRAWLKHGAEARTNSELRSLFKDHSATVQQELQALSGEPATGS